MSIEKKDSRGDNFLARIKYIYRPITLVSFFLTIYMIAILASPPSSRVAIVLSFFIAVFIPIIIIGARQQMRTKRVRTIEIFEKIFGKNANVKDSIAFESVKSKYFLDLNKIDFLNARSKDLHEYPFVNQCDWLIVISAIPFMAVSLFWLLIFFCSKEMIAPGAWIVNFPIFLRGNIERALIIGSYTAIGAIIFSLTVFIRAIIVFELHQTTFLRTFTHLLVSPVAMVILWSTADNLLGVLQNDTTSIWYFSAFLAGYYPLDNLMRMRRRHSSYIFRHDGNKGNTISTTEIGGISHFTSFLLDQINICNVQNLATVNPIMLAIESNYTIGQIINWITQAQLCDAIGKEKFHLLRDIQITSIGELRENISNDNYSQKQKNYIAHILLSESRSAQKILDKFFINAEEIRKTREISIDAARHMIDSISNRDHVLRFCQIRNEIFDISMDVSDKTVNELRKKIMESEADLVKSTRKRQG